MESLLKMSAPNPLGTLAFVLDEEVLLVRVSNGWQYVAVILAHPIHTALILLLLYTVCLFLFLSPLLLHSLPRNLHYTSFEMKTMLHSLAR